MILHLEKNDLVYGRNKSIDELEYYDFVSYTREPYLMATMVYCNIGDDYKFLKQRYADINAPYNHKQIFTKSEIYEILDFFNNPKYNQLEEITLR